MMRTVFQRLLIQKGWMIPGTRLVVGVSGGVDSMVLLHLLLGLLRDTPVSIVAAHLNHCLRGRESDRDEQFVRAISEKWGVSVEVGREDVGAAARQEKLPIQVAARKARYRFFEEVMKRREGTWLVLGHHADDVSETVMMRFLRGASVQGLRGIPLQNGSVIRPLLSFSRQEIIAYAHDNSVPYVEDSSNKKFKYLRNRVRHDLLPHVRRDYQPAFDKQLRRYASYFDEIHSLLAELVEKAMDGTVGHEGEILLGKFRKIPVAVQRVLLETHLLENGFVKAPLSFVQLDAILEMTAQRAGTQTLNLSGGLIAVREYDTLRFEKKAAVRGFTPLVCPVPGQVKIPETGLNFVVEDLRAPPKDLQSSEKEAYVNGDRIGDSLVVRPFQPGDRFVAHGKIKLKKFFIDTRIPARRRLAVPIIVADGNIVWVGGLRVDRRFFVIPGTRRILKLRLNSLRRDA
jgi:tRNA(Ile)-lysidine synthase